MTLRSRAEMKRIAVLVLLATIICVALAGCVEKKTEEKFEIREIKEYFFEVGTYTSLDYDFVDKYFRDENDNWGGGCSAISAIIDGTRLVGRNMDLNISDKCAYAVRTNVPGKYETIGLAYTFRDVSPDYESVKKDGLTADFEKILPFMCDDVMNSEGLHIEINMRHSEIDAKGNDVFGVEHTNSVAAERVYVFNLTQYIALNCKNLAEAKDYLKNSVDVYSKKNYWNYCFIVTDGEGNSALLEFGNGKYYWTDPDENGIVAQTNFYVNRECNELEEIKTGLGRYDALMNGIEYVKNKGDLYNLMKKVSYSRYYSGFENCKNNHFDPRSEIIGESNEYGFDLTCDFVFSPDNQELISSVLTSIGEYVNSLTRAEQQKENTYWESTFTEVVSTKERKIEVRIFENDAYLYEFTFDGIKPIEKIG